MAVILKYMYLQMLTFYDVLHETKQKTQTLESAQYGLEIIFKHILILIDLALILKSNIIKSKSDQSVGLFLQLPPPSIQRNLKTTTLRFSAEGGGKTF